MRSSKIIHIYLNYKISLKFVYLVFIFVKPVLSTDFCKLCIKSGELRC